MPNLSFAFQMAAVVAGALGGTLLGIAGGSGGDLARRGEHRRWITVVFAMVVALGAVTAIVGLVAGGLSQPPSVWLGLVIIGVGLIALTWGANRHLAALRAVAPSSRNLDSDEPDKSS
jgi:protein-S-isoprenylcysteine O-methyltransferase Ste14